MIYHLIGIYFVYDISNNRVFFGFWRFFFSFGSVRPVG